MKKLVAQKLKNFFSQYKQQKFKKREILIRADDQPTGIFFLEEGVVRQYVNLPSGEELNLNIYKPISFFPMSYAINNTVNHYYYEALTPVCVWKAPKEEVLEFIKKEPDVLLDLLSRIYRGLEGFFQRIAYLMAGNAKGRIITELLIYAQRFGSKEDNAVAVNFKFTQQDLAAQSGIARETVNRILKTLKVKGLISFKDRKLVISSLEELEKELYLSI